MKRRPKAGSVDLCWARPDTADISSEITPRKEKQRGKRKSEGEERRKKEKKAMVALLVFVMAAMMASFGLKNKNCHVDKIIRLAQALGLATSSIH